MCIFNGLKINKDLIVCIMKLEALKAIKFPQLMQNAYKKIQYTILYAPYKYIENLNFIQIREIL